MTSKGACISPDTVGPYGISVFVYEDWDYSFSSRKNFNLIINKHPLMKNTITNLLALKPMLICLIMVGLYVVSAPTLQAQTSSFGDTFLTVPSGPYVSASTAITRLEDQCTAFKGQLEIFNPASNEYKTALDKYNFYSAILTPLYDGKTVQESLVAGLTLLQTDSYGTYTRQQKQQMKQDAISLLTQ